MASLLVIIEYYMGLVLIVNVSVKRDVMSFESDPCFGSKQTAKGVTTFGRQFEI
jgi:hypothetical protein